MQICLISLKTPKRRGENGAEAATGSSPERVRRMDGLIRKSVH